MDIVHANMGYNKESDHSWAVVGLPTTVLNVQVCVNVCFTSQIGLNLKCVSTGMKYYI